MQTACEMRYRLLYRVIQYRDQGVLFRVGRREFKLSGGNIFNLIFSVINAPLKPEIATEKNFTENKILMQLSSSVPVP